MPSYSKDGNFQQTQHNKRMDKNDVALTKGASYYVNEDGYAEYLKVCKGSLSEQEVWKHNVNE